MCGQRLGVGVFSLIPLAGDSHPAESVWEYTVTFE